MTAPILDQIRSAAHDAGAATGVVVTDLSDGAIETFHSFDTDRVVDLTAPFVGGAVEVASSLGRKLNIRRVLIGVGTVAAAGIVIAAIVRFKRRGGRHESAPVSTHGMHGEPRTRDGQGARSEHDVHATAAPLTAIRG